MKKVHAWKKFNDEVVKYQRKGVWWINLIDEEIWLMKKVDSLISNMGFDDRYTDIWLCRC